MDITKVTRMYGSTDNWYKSMSDGDKDRHELISEYNQLLNNCDELYTQLIKEKHGRV
jgi:hypothetical protein